MRVGIIGLDTSHAVAFARLMNREAGDGALARVRVVAAYPGGSPDIPVSRDRVERFTDQVREQGVEIVGSIPALLARVDAVLLESVDGRTHLAQATAVLDAGKRLFIDKPLAASLRDCVRIHTLAMERGVPCFSSSALRFAPGIRAVRDKVGRVLGCDAFGPATLEEHHPDLFWYGIHGVEILFTIMGPGCRSVTRTQTEDFEQVTGVWDGGRIGTFRGLRGGKRDYGALVFGDRGIERSGGFEGYEGLVAAIAEFLAGGDPPVPMVETLEIYAFMEAADESRRLGGRPVDPRRLLNRLLMGAAAPSVPIGAWRGKWEAVDSASLRLEDAWVTDVIPPGGGRTVLDLRLEGSGLTWVLDRRHDFGDSPGRRVGSLDHAAGARLLVEQLRRLDAAGVLDLPPRPEADPGLLFEAHATAFSLTLRGAPGETRLDLRLPSGAEHGGYGKQVAALRELVEAFGR